MKNFLLKIYYILLSFRTFIIILYNKVFALYAKPPIVKTTDETLEKIVNGEFSISRYGDGEFALMYGRDLLFQPYFKELSLRLREIIQTKHDNHIVCIPNVFKSVDWCTDKSKAYWMKYLNLNRSRIYRLLDMNREDYYDTQVTRLYIDHKDKSNAEERFTKFKKLWNNRELVIVEGEQSRLGIGNNLFDNVHSIKRIICPSINAFAKYNEILLEIKKYDKSKLILIALGPTATVLAYDLSMVGYVAIDIGHIDIEYEWFLQNATEKCPVKNKYIGEVPNGTAVGEIDDFKYKNEIIARVV